MFKALQNSLLSLIYPQECRVCSRQVESHSDGIACRECWAATRIFGGSEMLCGKCGAFFGDEAAPITVFCHKCDDHHYDRAAAIGVYEKALSASILHLKTVPLLPYRLKTVVPSLKRTDVLDGVDVLVPVPLSRRRRHERGYNQAEIIAEAVSTSLRVPIDKHSLARKLHTPIHRIGMDDKARDLTVRNAFELARPKLIDGKNILLVDDVFTSGATASSCAKILKKSGARKVNILTLARAVMH